MGQQPLIGENSFTTKHVAELDDDRFTPSSTSIPAPTWEENENRTSYFVLRNKYVILSSLITACSYLCVDSPSWFVVCGGRLSES